MNIAIIGAGGIGCYYAARLIQAGENVTLIARGAHLKALQTNGLSVAHPEINFNGKVKAHDLTSWMESTKPEQVDLIIVCLKAMQTEQLAKDLAQWLSANPTKNKPFILSLQNGVENEKHLKKYLHNEIILGGIARRIGAHIIKPGYVEAVGPAQVIFGLWPDNNNLSATVNTQFNNLAEKLNQARIPTEISPEINKELWRKLIINNGVNPLCALLKIETGIATSDQRLQVLIKGAMEEAAIAAKADNVHLSQAEVNEMFNLISTFDSIKPSMLVDREKQRPLEIDELCHVVIRGCEAMGEPAPYNQSITTLLTIDLENDPLYQQ